MYNPLDHNDVVKNIVSSNKISLAVSSKYLQLWNRFISKDHSQSFDDWEELWGESLQHILDRQP